MTLSRLVLLLTFTAQCYAQSNQAAISGVVTDPQGGVVPDTTVTATEIATGVQTPTKTNGTGKPTVTVPPPTTLTLGAPAPQQTTAAP